MRLVLPATGPRGNRSCVYVCVSQQILQGTRRGGCQVACEIGFERGRIIFLCPGFWYAVIFFALAEMPLVVEMVAAYSHPRGTSYTFWAMYVLIHVPFELTCRTCMCPVLHATGPTCTRSYMQRGPGQQRYIECS